MRIGGRGWLLAGALVASAGCAQIFGLGEYGPQGEDAGADAPNDTSSTFTSDAPSTNEASVDATPTSDSGHHDAGTSDGAPQDTGGPADSGDAAPDGPLFDPDACSGANTCAPIAPAGWQGPLVLWAGSGTPPACDSFYLPFFSGGTGLSAGAAQCTCSCGTPAGASCGPVTLQFGTSNCTTACGSSGGAMSVTPGMCTSVQAMTTACGTGAGANILGSTATGGACVPDGSVIVPPAQWATQAVACTPSAQSPAGCAAGEQCVPAPPTSFQTGFCIVKAGTNTCPPPFTNQHLYYADFSDSRGCSPCTCGAPSGVDCNAGAHASTWGNAQCAANPGLDLTPLPVACATFGTSHYLKITTAPDGGSCAPDGGASTGAAMAQDLTTVCCTP
jgi:hypothetical protein